MRLLLLIAILFTASFHSYGQEDSTAVQDTSHSVRKATILSAVLPGAGQIYNHTAMPKGKKKAFWKVPLIYAGLGTLGYFVIDNHRTVLDIRTAYNAVGAGTTVNPPYDIYDQSSLLTLHDQFARWRDFSIIGFVAVYAVQVIDAAVEAHFVNFDVSEDLSLRLAPTMLTPQAAGFKLSLNFH
ncbi:MAG: hypothetical protein DCO96_07620 [Fluviicola sp. XM-24bin1]|nr:MAG: hypothetical protein DCO96_07620 [Fluviicola sp. XM-24bin1]